MFDKVSVRGNFPWSCKLFHGFNRHIINLPLSDIFISVSWYLHCERAKQEIAFKWILLNPTKLTCFLSQYLINWRTYPFKKINFLIFKGLICIGPSRKNLQSYNSKCKNISFFCEMPSHGIFGCKISSGKIQ